jgi:hypothetical protein
VLHLQRKYHLGSIRIVWYLERCHGITNSNADVYRSFDAMVSTASRTAPQTERDAEKIIGEAEDIQLPQIWSGAAR